MGLYVYAIGRPDAIEPPAIPGVLEQPLYRLSTPALCAFVSDCKHGAIRAERRHIGAAQRVLAALNARCDVLPMAFGTVTQSEAALRRFLDEHNDVLKAQLERISGSVEMSLRLALEVADPVAYLVERSPELQAARDRAFRSRRPPSHEAKIRLGQLVEDVLRKYRDTHTAQVLASVRPSCAEIIALPVRDEREIANLAALVPRSAVGQFETAVRASAEQTDEDIIFKIGGPWPPHNFVEFDIRA